MKSITIKSPTVKENRLENKLILSTEVKKFFFEDVFWSEYGENIEKVPVSILNIPAFYNFLPMSLFLGVLLEVEELDEQTYLSVDKIAEGYQQIFPHLDIKPTIKVHKVVKNDNLVQGSAVLFSGGVDSTASFLVHEKEKPDFLTVNGADIRLHDVEGWEKVENAIKETSAIFGNSSHFVKSNFKEMLHDALLGETVSKNFGWWHDGQSSLGLLGLMAPISFEHSYKVIYMPGSYSVFRNFPCASDPAVDNHIRFANSVVSHDLFTHHRQMKIQEIIDFHKKKNMTISLRVCWEGKGGVNCLNCEKCIRSILGVIVAGGKPEDFGFSNFNEKSQEKFIYLFKHKLISLPNTKPFYIEIIDQIDITKHSKYLKLLTYFKNLDIEKHFRGVENPNSKFQKIIKKLQKKYVAVRYNN